MDPQCEYLWIPIVYPGGSLLWILDDPHGGSCWIPIVNPCGSPLWILVDPHCVTLWILILNPGGSQVWILVDFQRPFCIQNERENILYHLTKRPLL